MPQKSNPNGREFHHNRDLVAESYNHRGRQMWNRKQGAMVQEQHAQHISVLIQSSRKFSFSFIPQMLSLEKMRMQNKVYDG